MTTYLLCERCGRTVGVTEDISHTWCDRCEDLVAGLVASRSSAAIPTDATGKACRAPAVALAADDRLEELLDDWTAELRDRLEADAEAHEIDGELWP